jgi:hypothetical protein
VSDEPTYYRVAMQALEHAIRHGEIHDASVIVQYNSSAAGAGFSLRAMMLDKAAREGTDPCILPLRRP